MERKVINPLTEKKITVGKKLYNDLIAQGYVVVGDRLVKPDLTESSESIQSLESSEELINSDEELMPTRPINLNLPTRPQFGPRIVDDTPYDFYPNVRCINCNKPINKHKKYLELQGTMPEEEIYNQLGLKRGCCRLEYKVTPRHYSPSIPVAPSLSKNPFISSCKSVRVYQGGDKYLGLK